MNCYLACPGAIWHSHRMRDIKLIILSEGVFSSGGTCYVGLRLLFGTWGNQKVEYLGDQTFSVMAMHESWSVHDAPPY